MTNRFNYGFFGCPAVSCVTGPPTIESFSVQIFKVKCHALSPIGWKLMFSSIPGSYHIIPIVHWFGVEPPWFYHVVAQNQLCEICEHWNHSGRARNDIPLAAAAANCRNCGEGPVAKAKTCFSIVFKSDVMQSLEHRLPYGGFLKWGYPQIIHFNWVFH